MRDTKDHIFGSTRLLDGAVDRELETDICNTSNLGFWDEWSTRMNQLERYELKDESLPDRTECVEALSSGPG